MKSASEEESIAEIVARVIPVINVVRRYNRIPEITGGKYFNDDESVVFESKHGTQKISVSCDSVSAALRDIINNVEM